MKGYTSLWRSYNIVILVDRLLTLIIWPSMVTIKNDETFIKFVKKRKSSVLLYCKIAVKNWMKIFDFLLNLRIEAYNCHWQFICLYWSNSNILILIQWYFICLLLIKLFRQELLYRGMSVQDNISYKDRWQVIWPYINGYL
jgi:hypothetical protein